MTTALKDLTLKAAHHWVINLILRIVSVHTLMLSSHRFLCLPLRLPPWTVPCKIVLASPDDRMACPYHFSLRLFTAVRSSYGPMAFPILALTSSLVMWSLYHWYCDLCMRYRGVCGNISSPMPVSFFQYLLLWSTFHMHTKIWAWPGNASVWSWSWWRRSCRSRWLLVWSLELWHGLSWRVLQAWILHLIL